ncbi:(S)-2-haloacid dehalogenase [bacterium HR31]|nr:(S)-2-haloacid dehalogenase [bacterium HR31]
MTGRWPKAIFYDSKGTLFNWAWTWRRTAELLVERYAPDVSVEAFLSDWIGLFEGVHRRAAFRRYSDFFGTLVRDALSLACRLHRVPADVDEGLGILTGLQEHVEPFPDVPEALRRQQRELGVKVIVFSDVERRYLDMYLRKLPGFQPDFVGTTEEARIQKPNPRVYRWVLHRVGLDARDVLYCAGPQFDVQGAMAAGMKAAWVNRPEGRLDTSEGDLPPDYEVQDLLELTDLVAANLGRAGRV